MRVRDIASLAVLLALGFPAVAAPPVLRDSPEFTIVDPSGHTTPLSSFKGQVVVIEFLLYRCPSCLRIAQTINKLHGEMANRGFRPIGIVFDDGVTEPVVHDLALLLKLNYLVGYTTSDQVDRYLGRAGIIRLQVPQVVVIDRAGVIRAQSRPSGETNLTDESYLRNLVRELLDEGVPPGKSETSTVPPKPSD
ncbi:MAG TPA: TlpA disulfide reductase family protein [Steroidobacteraceae bacterium]|jgi:peroxiredoxin|nr:TlpA disulfide reductase family protein [Steroidobacteraceae bacterium]